MNVDGKLSVKEISSLCSFAEIFSEMAAAEL